MRLHIVNPITTEAMTAKIAAAARAVALPGTVIDARQPEMGPVSIEGFYDEAFAADVPYDIAVVETEEGVRLTSQVVECDALEIAMALEVTFERVSDEVAIPKFRPRR